jgi:hypothetical protein
MPRWQQATGALLAPAACATGFSKAAETCCIAHCTNRPVAWAPGRNAMCSSSWQQVCMRSVCVTPQPPPSAPPFSASRLSVCMHTPLSPSLQFVQGSSAITTCPPSLNAAAEAQRHWQLTAPTPCLLACVCCPLWWEAWQSGLLDTHTSLPYASGVYHRRSRSNYSFMLSLPAAVQGC